MDRSHDVKFSGAKAALIFEDKVVVIKRDDNPNIPFPNMWDLVGGGRDNNETPIECLIREVKEEINLDLSSYQIDWIKTYPSISGPGLIAFFMVIVISALDIEKIVLGDEGQEWKLMKIQEYLTNNEVIDRHKGKLRDYLNSKQ